MEPWTCWQNGELLDDWEVLAGALEASTKRVYRGSRSVHLTGAGDGRTKVRIPIEEVDLTETTFSLAMYIDAPGNPTPRRSTTRARSAC